MRGLECECGMRDEEGVGVWVEWNGASGGTGGSDRVRECGRSHVRRWRSVWDPKEVSGPLCVIRDGAEGWGASARAGRGVCVCVCVRECEYVWERAPQ